MQFATWCTFHGIYCSLRNLGLNLTSGWSGGTACFGDGWGAVEEGVCGGTSTQLFCKWERTGIRAAGGCWEKKPTPAAHCSGLTVYSHLRWGKKTKQFLLPGHGKGLVTITKTYITIQSPWKTLSAKHSHAVLFMAYSFLVVTPTDIWRVKMRKIEAKEEQKIKHFFSWWKVLIRWYIFNKTNLCKAFNYHATVYSVLPQTSTSLSLYIF